ncbi:hypothetical protein HNY73_010245 [Argiope bruennichi]|uniref:Uncharacterized protein n=1 Tax=Argiope bruennichi TaxID=94029 RepID=A0A8T0F177_ARGBR|nr:hypothetical protein HNY73_010245 [Argiope bruennichi]
MPSYEEVWKKKRKRPCYLKRLPKIQRKSSQKQQPAWLLSSLNWEIQSITQDQNNPTHLDQLGKQETKESCFAAGLLYYSTLHSRSFNSSWRSDKIVGLHKKPSFSDTTHRHEIWFPFALLQTSNQLSGLKFKEYDQLYLQC